MTTIAADARAGVMVSDSRCTGSDQWFPMTKVHRIGDELLGLAGNVKDCNTWLKWYRGGKKGGRPKLENFIAIALRKDGVYEIGADGLDMLIERGFHGVGSGGAIAVGVLIAGHDAKTAVEIACQVDPGSGGGVVTYTLEP